MMKAILFRLLAADALTGLVGRRINLKRRVQGEGLPAVVLHRISGDLRRTIAGEVALIHGRIQIDCWGDSPRQIEAVVSAVKGALDKARFEHPSASIRGVFLLSEEDDDGMETPLTDQTPMRTRLDFTVHFTPA